MPDEEQKHPKLQAKTLDRDQCVKLIQGMWKRHSALRQRIQYRRAHFQNDSSVNPNLFEPLSHITYQSDAPRRIWGDTKDRLVENHWVIHSSPSKPTADQNAAAEDAEAVFQSGLMLAEERNGVQLQDALSDGQLVDCYGILHWRLATHLWPEVPEYEYCDYLPEDESEKKRYQPNEDGEEEDDDKPKRKYRETDASVQERHRENKARAGFPWIVETPIPQTYADVEDRAGAISMACLVQEVGLLDYSDELKDNDKLILALNEYGGLKEVRVYMENQAPTADGPSRNDWGQTIRVATLWTRGEWYELATKADLHKATLEGVDLTVEDWVLVKSGTHPYGRPPFEKVIAERFNDPDPALRYLPALEGVFRLKPFFDRDMALLKGLSERTALPDLYLVKLKDGSYMTAEDGKVVQLTRDSAHAQELPDGYELKKIDMEVSQGFVDSVRMTREEYAEAAPPTGTAEITASSQPWTVRLGQAQASVKPKKLANVQARAIAAMVRNMAKVTSLPLDEGGIGEAVATFRVDKENGEFDMSQTVSVEPEQIKSLNFSVTINPQSSAEQITSTEHGIGLLERGVITLRDLMENYMNVPNPSQKIIELRADRIFTEYLEPNLLAMKVAERYGPKVALGPDGQLVGADGSPVDPAALAASNGWAPIPQPGITPGGAGFAPPGGSPAGQVQMPDLSGAQPAGVMAMPGVPG